MVVFEILLDFSAVSTFVLRSKANILDSSRKKRFLLLSPLINSSNSSCIESEVDDKRSKMPSVESSLSLSLLNYASSFLVTSPKISALLVSTPACDGSKSKRFSVDLSKLLSDILKYLYFATS